MEYKNFFFLLFSSLIFGSSLMVIRSTNAVHSVLFLIFAFVNTTALLLLSKVEFLAIMLIIIYVGAVAILFLFVVMMLDIPVHFVNKKEVFNYIPIFILIGFLFGIETFFVLKNSFFQNMNSTDISIITFDIQTNEEKKQEFALFKSLMEKKSANDSPFNVEGLYETNPSFLNQNTFTFDIYDTITNIETLGQIIYAYYGSLFLIIGIILLVALIGAVILTIQEKKQVNFQLIYNQLSRETSNAILNFSKKRKL